MSPFLPEPASSVTIERPCLYLVATPIGNLGDISLRALGVLAECDLLFAEDTRNTLRLLDHYGISRKSQALHEHNERSLAPGLILRLRQEQLSMALVSDAGTPLISDPGFPLVQAALSEGVPVRAIPGANAALTALCVSGMPTDRFIYEGFLPPREQAARSRLSALASNTRTLIFYESPRRAKQTLRIMREVFGDNRPACVCRELTKLHETHYRGSLAEIEAAIDADPFGDAGEFVLLVGPAPEEVADAREIGRVLALLSTEVSRRTAIDLTAKILGRPRNEVYTFALQDEPKA
ncbi:MAG: 16S rRNA (cytidine(1402)-2'-O)-methyltransferase [Gammaproteobacteria bacterium]|nr:16S rRNA (cytidine(1402)-2'-O)-methyltransferase [Gammaproteobacteria bacterium]